MAKRKAKPKSPEPSKAPPPALPSAPARSADEKALLAAVIAQPEEDTPRLIYADWLQENGQPDRAEFIRLHIEWCHRAINAPPNEDLKQRLTTLWDQGANTWRKEFEGVTHVYDRGFVAGINRPHGLSFWDGAEPFVTRAPVRFASFADAYSTEEADQVIANPRFSQLIGVGCWMRSGLGADFVRRLFAHPHASKIRVLDMNGCDNTGSATYRALAEATGLTGLQVLDAGGGNMEDAELEIVLSAKQFASLVSLRLGHDHYHGSDCTNHFGSDGLAAFSHASHLVNLKQLDLSADNWVEVDTIEPLLKWEGISQLTELSLKWTLSEREIAMLARSRKLKNLQRLELGSLSANDARALLQAKHLDNLREICWYDWSDAEEADDDLAAKMGERFGTANDFEFSIVCDEDRISRRLRPLFISDRGESSML